MQDAWGSFFLILFRRLSGSVPIFRPTSRLTGCSYGIACLPDCGSAQGAFTAPLLFCPFCKYKGLTVPRSYLHGSNNQIS